MHKRKAITMKYFLENLYREEKHSPGIVTGKAQIYIDGISYEKHVYMGDAFDAAYQLKLDLIKEGLLIN